MTVTEIRDRTGEKVGTLTVVRQAPSRNERTRWIAVCVSCGRTVEVSTRTLFRIEREGRDRCGCKYLSSADNPRPPSVRSDIGEVDFGERGKDDWQIAVLRERRQREIARGRC